MNMLKNISKYNNEYFENLFECSKEKMVTIESSLIRDFYDVKNEC